MCVYSIIMCIYVYKVFRNSAKWELTESWFLGKPFSGASSRRERRKTLDEAPSLLAHNSPLPEGFCPSQGSYCVRKRHDQKQVEEERVYLTYTSILVHH